MELNPCRRDAAKPPPAVLSGTLTGGGLSAYSQDFQISERHNAVLNDLHQSGREGFPDINLRRSPRRGLWIDQLSFGISRKRMSGLAMVPDSTS